jgi:hypothetical protein
LVRGQELRAIRDGKLYQRRYNFSDFEEYCDQRWELTPQHANRLTAASAFAEACQNQLVPIPPRESHIRPLLARLIVQIVRDRLDALLPEPVGHFRAREAEERERLRALLNRRRRP